MSTPITITIADYNKTEIFQMPIMSSSDESELKHLIAKLDVFLAKIGSAVHVKMTEYIPIGKEVLPVEMVK